MGAKVPGKSLGPGTWVLDGDRPDHEALVLAQRGGQRGQAGLRHLLLAQRRPCLVQRG